MYDVIKDGWKIRKTLTSTLGWNSILQLRIFLWWWNELEVANSIFVLFTLIMANSSWKLFLWLSVLNNPLFQFGVLFSNKKNIWVWKPRGLSRTKCTWTKFCPFQNCNLCTLTLLWPLVKFLIKKLSSYLG